MPSATAAEREERINVLIEDFERACEDCATLGTRHVPETHKHRAILRNELRAALLAARREKETLRRALIAHRADLHNGSKRPCPTCYQSAHALGIADKVPDSCALRDKDAAALAATPEQT